MRPLRGWNNLEVLKRVAYITHAGGGASADAPVTRRADLSPVTQRRSPMTQRA